MSPSGWAELESRMSRAFTASEANVQPDSPFSVLRQDFLWRNWQVPDALASAMEDSVGDRGGRSDNSELADTLCANGIVHGVLLGHEDDLNVGDVCMNGDAIIDEVPSDESADRGIDGALLEQRHADPADDRADELAARS